MLLGFLVALGSLLIFSPSFFGGWLLEIFEPGSVAAGGYRNGDQSTASLTHFSLAPHLSLSALFSIKQQTTRFSSPCIQALFWIFFKTLLSQATFKNKNNKQRGGLLIFIFPSTCSLALSKKTPPENRFYCFSVEQHSLKREIIFVP